MSGSNLYCARADVTKRIPIGSVTSSSGIVAETEVGDNTFTFDGHGLETDDAVSVRAVEGGSLPSPLVEGVYYAIRVTNSTFSLAATPSGSAIDITSAAVSMVITREPDFDDTIEFYSRWADTCLPAHLVPLDVPLTGQFVFVKGIVADLSAKKILNGVGKESAIVTAAELEAKAQLERFAAGLPLRGTATSTPSNLAITNNVATTGDPRGWGSGSLP